MLSEIVREYHIMGFHPVPFCGQQLPQTLFTVVASLLHFVRSPTAGTSRKYTPWKLIATRPSLCGKHDLLSSFLRSSMEHQSITRWAGGLQINRGHATGAASKTPRETAGCETGSLIKDTWGTKGTAEKRSCLYILFHTSYLCDSGKVQQIQ